MTHVGMLRFLLPYGPAPVPITWWPLCQPLMWSKDVLCAQYVITCEHVSEVMPYQVIVGAADRRDVYTFIYEAVIRVGLAVADHHQGLFARGLRDLLDDRGYLFPSGPW